MKVLAIVYGLHHGNAVRALYILSRVLAGSYVYSGDNIAGVGIEPTKSAGQCGPGKVFKHVKLHQSSYICLQYLSHHLLLDHCLTHH